MVVDHRSVEEFNRKAGGAEKGWQDIRDQYVDFVVEKDKSYF